MIGLSDRARWEAAVARVPHAIAHTWAYNQALQASWPDPIFLFAAGDPGATILCPISKRSLGRDSDLVTPFGFAGPVGDGDPAGFSAALDDYGAQTGAVAAYLGLHPLLAPGGLRTLPDTSHSNTAYFLDLTLGATGLARRMSRNYRRILKSFDDERAQYVEGDATAGAVLLDLFPSFMRARGAEPVYAMTRLTLQGLCDMEGSTVVAYPRGRPVAAILAARTAHCAELLFAVASEDGRRFLLGLTWYVVEVMMRQQVRWLGIGSGVQEGDSVAEAKRRLGGERRPRLAIKRILNAARYRELCLEHGADPADRSGFFPAYRRESKQRMSERDG